MRAGRFQYSESILSTGKDCFLRRAKQCSLSSNQTDRCVWQSWFSEVLPSVPARGRHLYWKISPFPSVPPDANTHPDLLFFSFLFSPLPACAFSACFQLARCFCLKKLIFSPLYLPPLHLFNIMPPLPPRPPIPTPNSLSSPLISSLSPSRPLTKVSERGNEKCMYSVALPCGSRRENCCFMVLFMDL